MATWLKNLYCNPSSAVHQLFSVKRKLNRLVCEVYRCKETCNLVCAETENTLCAEVGRYSCVREVQGHVQTLSH